MESFMTTRKKKIIAKPETVAPEEEGGSAEEGMRLN
jgi:hypothetical protein